MNADSYIDVKPNRNIPDFRPGDTVRVSVRVIEGERTRTQAFEGVVIRIKRGGVNSSFTVRRVSHGVGIERVFPYHSPLVEKVDVTRVGKVRRARLYYLRERVGKAARIKAGSRARFEALTNRPYIEEEQVDALAVDEEELAAEEADVVAEEGAEEAPDAEAATDEVIEAEGGAEAGEGETPAEEPAEEAPVVEEPETPEAEALEDTIEIESGEEPGEATGDK